MASLVVGLAFALYGMNQASERARNAQAIADVLGDMIVGSNPYEMKGDQPVTVEMMLDQMHATAKERLQDQPEVLLQILKHLSQAYFTHSRMRSAVDVGKEAHSVAMQLYGENHLETAYIADHLGGMLTTSFPDSAREESHYYLNSSYRAYADLLGDEHHATLVTLIYLGKWNRQYSEAEEAEKIYNKVLTICRKHAGDTAYDNTRAFLLHTLIRSHRDSKDYPETMRLAEELHALRRRMHGPNHPNTLNAKYDVGRAYWWNGQLDRATAVLIEVLKTQSDRLGPDHLDVAETHQALAGVEIASLHFKDAIAHAESAYHIFKSNNPKGEDTILGLISLIGVVTTAGQSVGAEGLQMELLQHFRDELANLRTSPDSIEQTFRNLIQISFTYFDACGSGDPVSQTMLQLLVPALREHGRQTELEEFEPLLTK